MLTATGGAIQIEGVTLQTDSTGLAGGTNFQLISNNTKGLTGTAAPWMAETVANLSANKTIDLVGASATKIRQVIESGKILQANSTVGNCTGAGTIDIYVTGRRLSAGAVLI